MLGTLRHRGKESQSCAMGHDHRQRSAVGVVRPDTRGPHRGFGGGGDRGHADPQLVASARRDRSSYLPGEGVGVKPGSLTDRAMGRGKWKIAVCLVAADEVVSILALTLALLYLLGII